MKTATLRMTALVLALSLGACLRAGGWRRELRTAASATFRRTPTSS